MAVTITPTPASGAIEAKKTVVRFDISGADPNDEGSFNANIYPTSPEFRYVLTMVESAVEYGRSQVFGVTPVGAFQINNYIFPHAGTWTVQLYDVTDPNNEVAKTTAAEVVVS